MKAPTKELLCELIKNSSTFKVTAPGELPNLHGKLVNIQLYFLGADGVAALNKLLEENK